MTTKARVVVTIKPDVFDPAGQALRKILDRQGIKGIKDVRIGKVIDVIFNEEHRDLNPTKSFDQIKTVVSNPIIEECRIFMADEQ